MTPAFAQDDAPVPDYDDYAGSDGAATPDNPEELPPLPEPIFDSVQEGIVPLGHDHDTFFYLSRAARQVFAITAGAHSRNILMAMASVAHYWQRSRFVNTKGAVQWDEAIDHLMVSCRQIGIFDPSRIRGRGAWIDGGRSVLHIGDKLIVDGEPQSLMLSGSPYVYEAARRLQSRTTHPLGIKDANKIVGLCQRLRWELGVSGTFFAGFIAVAPICGGLQWRPSIWITGGAGSGKTWAVENLLAPLMGGMAVRVQSKTSEAGIRQLLGSDALPVLFDEAEREDAASAARMQGVLDLVRQASSESGAGIVKGSQNQAAAKIYRNRSCFAFSSINVGIEHQADDSRITVLALQSAPEGGNPAAEMAFRRLQADVAALVTPDFAAALVARSVRLLPIIRANAETFSSAIATLVGSRRRGDQVGALLAGAYSLHSDRAVTAEEAEAYVKRQQWNESAEAGERDEIKLLSHLKEHRVRVHPGNAAPFEVTIARLIVAAWGGDEYIAPDVAERELRTVGLKTDGQRGIFVSTSHPTLKSILSGTPWAAGWGRSLARIPGTEPSTGNVVRFGPLHASKAVRITREALGGD